MLATSLPSSPVEGGFSYERIVKNEMDRSLYFRRAVAVFLCCLLVFRSTLPVARAAEPVTASLTIAAGAMALGGLSAAAVESTIGPQVAAIIGTTMEGLGTSVYTAEDSALTKTKFIMSKIAVWCVQAKIAKEDFYKRVAEGVTVAANGTIQLTHDASKLISQFVSWVYTQGTDTIVPEIVSDGKTASIGDYNFSGGALQSLNSNTIVFPCSGTYSSSLAMVGLNVASSSYVGSDVFIARTTDNYIIIVSSVNMSSFDSYYRRINYIASNGDYNWSSFNYRFSSGGMYVYSNSTLARYITTSSFPLLNVTFQNFQNSISGKSWEVSDSLPAQDVFVGQKADWDENKDLLNPSIDDVTTITPDLINKLIDQLADGQTATMDIATYLDSLVDAFDGLKAQVAELTDAVTGAKTNVAVPDSITTSVTVDPVNPISVPAVEPVELTPGGTIEGFSFPLDEIFPFCIPFDVVAALELFDVPAEAPSLHVHWELPYNIVFDFDLDLSAYDDIAALLRVMETILFAVGLAVATRSLYIRS